jgi:glucan biosynthesis protein C
MDHQKKSDDTLEERLFFIDNIRWLMIVFVVLMHLNVTYSNMGLWYYKEPVKMDALSGVLFALYGCFTQAYFMGLLFFIAGYFVPGSFDRKGAGGFVHDRLIRLGIPTLFYMLLIHPITIIIIGFFNHNNPTNLTSWYIEYLTSFAFISSSGPLWFVLALLVFSILYAFLRQFSLIPAYIAKQDMPILLKNTWIIAVIALISIVAFLIRLVQPAGIPLFNTFTGNFMQIGNFSSYIILFILGIIFYQGNLLMNLPYKLGRFWFKLALLLGAPLWFIIMITGIKTNPAALFGEFHWQSAVYSTWESFFCVGVSLGLLAIFQKKYNKQGRVRKFLSENAFRVYVLHTPILVGITMMLSGIVLNPLVKMIMMTIIVLPICFGFSHLTRKVPLPKYFSKGQITHQQHEKG